MAILLGSQNTTETKRKTKEKLTSSSTTQQPKAQSMTTTNTKKMEFVPRKTKTRKCGGAFQFSLPSTEPQPTAADDHASLFRKDLKYVIM